MTTASGAAARVYRHLFISPDASRCCSCGSGGEDDAVVDVLLTRAAARATEYPIDGSASLVQGFDGRVLRALALRAGAVRMFSLDPS